MIRSGLRHFALGSLSLLMLPACMTAANYTEQEQETATNLTPSQYQSATREMRDNIKTQDMLAQAAFWSREYQLNPADLEAAVNLASTVRKMGNPAKAVEITQTTRALYPTDPYLTAEYAAALIASERGNEALKPLDTALRTAPAYARLWSLKGAALDQIENYDLARKHYMRALKITPNDPNVMANLGLSYALAGDPRTAETWLRRAAAQPGSDAHIQQNLDLVLQLQGKQVQARPTPRPAPSTYPQRQQVSQNGAMPGLRGTPSQPVNTFGYSTNVYTSNQKTAGAPKTASEAAMAAAQQSGRAGSSTGAAPAGNPEVLSRISRSLAPQKYSMNTPQRQPIPNPQTQPVQTYPPQNYYPQAQAMTSGSPVPPRRAPARRR